ncbi:hypothetical protein VTI74DRAFT_3819 [Chaetomium olivicolor]
MRFFANILSASAIAVILATPSLAAPWDASLCARSALVGSSTGGSPFTLLAEEGATVSDIRVWRSTGRKPFLRGLSLGFTDGSSQSAGASRDQYQTLSLEEGEIITDMSIWTSRRNGTRARLARIDVSTNKRSWGYGVEDTRGLTSHAVSVGSVLVGFQGRAGSDLDQIAPIFLKAVSQARIENIVFESIPGPDSVRPVTLAEGSVVWNGTDHTWTFAGSETREVSSTFNTLTSNQLALGASLSLEPSGMGKWGGSATWTAGAQGSRELKRSGTQVLNWSFSININAQNPSVRCSAVTWEGRVSTNWSGTLTMTVGGRAISSPISGTYNEISYSKVDTICGPPGSEEISTVSKFGERWTA